MPLILVVEQEKRYVERIEEALSPQGWEVIGVADRAGVMRLVADRAADLLVVNAEVDEAAELVSSFSRAAGGPGTVVLVPEAGDNNDVRANADEVLEKPFTDQDIRLAVRRCVSAGRDAAAEEAPAPVPPPSGERLSSEELFGDVVLELEDAFTAGAGAQAAGEGAEEPLREDEAVGAEAEAEIDDALSGIELEQPVAEAGVAEPTVEEELVEEVLEEEGVEEPAEEAPVEELPLSVEPESVVEEVDEAVEVAADEDLEEEELVAEAEVELAEAAEEDAVEELPEVGEEPEAEPAEEAEEEPELDELVEEESTEVEPVPEEVGPARPAKPDLEDRLREAVLAGKAAAAASESAPTAEMDSGAAADLLLQKALGTLSWESKPKIDEEFSKPAHATDEEIDKLVGTVVSERRDEPSEELFEETLDDAPDVDEGPGLDVVEAELLERDEGEYRDRMKLVWAIIIIALLAALAFVVTRSLNDDAPAEPPAAASPAAVERRAADAVDDAEPEGTDESGGAAGPETGTGGDDGDTTEENGGDA